MSYDISNQASYDYLQAFRNIILPAVIDPHDANPVYAPTAQFIESFSPIIAQPFDVTIDYKNLYRELHLLAEKIALNPDPNTLPSPYKEFHFDLFKMLYENDSGLHHVIHTHIGMSSDMAPAPRSVKINQNLEREGIKKGKLSHMIGELPAMTGIAFDPLKDTNIPYVAFPRLGKDSNEPIILRFGQQTYRFSTQLVGKDELQPAFLNYLAVKHAEHPEKPFHHLYFNLMKRDIEVGESGAGKKYTRNIVEGPKTATLESINTMPLGTAVITLPADVPQFLEGFDKHKGRAHDPRIEYDIAKLKAEIINSVIANEHDFYIPDNVRTLLGKEFHADLDRLFDSAIMTMIGAPHVSSVNAAQRQAIVFEFVKYQLSRYLIEKLRPDTVNFSCKDAIDRGGVHTLYYEVRNRLEQGSTMTKDEFNTNLDAPALTVHHRPANENRELLFNALREYYLTNSDMFEHPDWQWMSHSLIQNHPDSVAISMLRVKPNPTDEDKDFLERYYQEIGKITLAALNESEDFQLNFSRQSPTSSSSRTPSPQHTPPRALKPTRSSASSSSESLSDGDETRKAILFVSKSKKHQPLSSTQIAQLMLQTSIDLESIENSINDHASSVYLIDESHKLTKRTAHKIAQKAVREAAPNTVFDLSDTTENKAVFKKALIEAIDSKGYGKRLTIKDRHAKTKKRI